MENTINVTIHPNDGLLLAITPKTPESAKNMPHQIPVPTNCTPGNLVDNPTACVIMAKTAITN